MSQINSNKTTTFDAPPIGKVGLGADVDGNWGGIDSGGVHKKFLTEVPDSGVPNILCNLGVGVAADLPGTFVSGDKYATTDTLKLYTADDSLTWTIIDLVESQIYADSSSGTAVFFIFDGTALKESASSSATDANAIHKNVVAEIDALTEKTALVDSDCFLGENSESSPTAFGKVKILWSTIKSGIRSYFEGIFGVQTLTSSAAITFNTITKYSSILTLEHDATITFTNLISGRSGILQVVGGAANHNLTFSPVIVNITDGLNVVPIVSGEIYYFSYFYDGTNLIVSYNKDLGEVYQTLANLRTSWQTNPDHLHYASEKLVKDSLNLKQNVFPGLDPATPVTITIDYTTRVLTITPVNSTFRFYVDGSGVSTMYEKTGAQNFTAFTDTSGIWHFYFDASGNPISTQVAWNDFDVIAPVYRLLWNSTLSGSAKSIVETLETHPATIPGIDHLWKHTYRTIHVSGGDLVRNELATGSPNASGLNTCIGLTSLTNMDDNLLYTIENSATVANWKQDLGITTPASLTTSNGALIDIRYDASSLQYRQAATRFPFSWASGSNRPEYISSAGVRTLVDNGYLFVYFVYAIQDQRNGKAVMLVSAPNHYANITLARAVNWSDIQAIYPTINDREVRPLYRLIFEYKNTYDAAVKYSVLRESQDIRQLAITSTVAGGSMPASSMTSLPTDNILSTNGQSDKAEIDYKLLGYATTATAAGTTILTNESKLNQYFTGTTTQTIQMPVVSTLTLGRKFFIKNNSTGILTVNSSGGNEIMKINPERGVILTCIAITGTGATSWEITCNSETIAVTCSGKDSDIAVAEGVAKFALNFNFLLIGCFAYVNTASTGLGITVDINNSGNSMLSTKLTIDATEKSSLTAATAYVINSSYSSYTAGNDITVDIDQVGSTIAGKGLIVIIDVIRK